MRRLVFCDVRVVRLVGDRCKAVWKAPVSIGVERNGEVIGGAVFSDMLPGLDINVNIAGKTNAYWCSRSFLRACFRYLFQQLKLRRVTCLIDAENAASISLCMRLGFRHEGTLRARGTLGQDVLIFGMLREECSWLPGELH